MKTISFKLALAFIFSIIVLVKASGQSNFMDLSGEWMTDDKKMLTMFWQNGAFVAYDENHQEHAKFMPMGPTEFRMSFMWTSSKGKAGLYTRKVIFKKETLSKKGGSKFLWRITRGSSPTQEMVINSLEVMTPPSQPIHQMPLYPPYQSYFQQPPVDSPPSDQSAWQSRSNPHRHANSLTNNNGPQYRNHGQPQLTTNMPLSSQQIQGQPRYPASDEKVVPTNPTFGQAQAHYSRIYPAPVYVPNVASGSTGAPPPTAYSGRQAPNQQTNFPYSGQYISTHPQHPMGTGAVQAQGMGLHRSKNLLTTAKDLRREEKIQRTAQKLELQALKTNKENLTGTRVQQGLSLISGITGAISGNISGVSGLVSSLSGSN